MSPRVSYEPEGLKIRVRQGRWPNLGFGQDIADYPCGKRAQVGMGTDIMASRLRIPLGAQPLGRFLFKLRDVKPGFLRGRLGDSQLFLRLLFPLTLVLKTQDIAHDLFGIPRSPKNRFGIVFENSNPMAHVGGMLAWVVANAQRITKHHRGNLGPKLFFGVSGRPKASA